MNKVSIIILTYQHLELTKQCIESIRAYTEEGTYEIIVVDNASSDQTVEWLRIQPDIKIIENSENVGFPAGCNQGVKSAQKGNDIMLLNNDTIVTSNWLKNLCLCLNSDEKIGAAGAVSVSNANLQGIDQPYIGLEQIQDYAKLHNLSSPTQWEEKIKLIGFCLLIRRSAWESLNGLDEAFSPGYYEDDDFSLRLLQAGYRLMLCHDCFIYHFLGSSFRSDRAKFYELLNTNQQKFIHKWGFPTYEFDRLVLQELEIGESDLVVSNRKMSILEIGCRIGAFLLKLKNKYPNATVIGIESNDQLYQIARLHSEVYLQHEYSYCGSIKEHSIDQIYLNREFRTINDLFLSLNAIQRYLTDTGNVILRFADINCKANINKLLKGDHMNETCNGCIVAGKQDVINMLNYFGYEAKLIEDDGADPESDQAQPYFIVKAERIKR